MAMFIDQPLALPGSAKYFSPNIAKLNKSIKKSRIQGTLNFSTVADGSTDTIFYFLAVKENFCRGFKKFVGEKCPIYWVFFGGGRIFIIFF